MTITRSLAQLQKEHVVLELECIDRMYLNAYQPKLTSEGGIAAFCRGCLGHHLGKVTEQSPRSANALRQVTAHYQERIEDLNDEFAEVLGWSDHREHWIATRRLRLESLEAKRRELIRLRRDHEVNEEITHQIERELDLEKARLRA